MSKPVVKLLMVLLLLVQIVAPVQKVLATQMAPSPGQKDHCQMQNATSDQKHAARGKTPCSTHCMSLDKFTHQGSANNCNNDSNSNCSTSCSDCSHGALMVLNEFVFMHQMASRSPLQNSYDIIKYFPPLILRPPRS